LRSGVNPEQFSELHGNSFVESCRKCGTVYLRDFAVTAFCGKEIPHSVLGKMGFREIQHLTGRLCKEEGCDGFLEDSIINFGENLPAEALERATENSKKADLSIVMGSSLTVRPASSLPKKSKNLIIINLQQTPLDDDKKLALRIWAKCDDVMRLLRKELELDIVEWEMPPPSELRLQCLREQKQENEAMDRKREERKQRAKELKEASQSGPETTTLPTDHPQQEENVEEPTGCCLS
jgi:hypothetical protein